MQGLLDRTPEELLAWAEAQAWVDPMRRTPQRRGEGDVWSQTVKAYTRLFELDPWRRLDETAQKVLALAVLFHHVGRPTTTEQRTDRIIAPNHAAYGRRITRQALIREPIDYRHRELIASLVRWHPVPVTITKRVRPQATVIETSWRTRNDLLHLLSVANSLVCEPGAQPALLERIGQFRALCRQMNCFDQPYPFANDKARFLWFRGALANPAARPPEDYACEVTMLVGLPGAGKDHWCREHAAALPMISLDGIRKELGVGWTDDQGRVLRVAEDRFTAFLKAGESFVYNATNIDRAMRRKWVRLVRQRGARIRMVYIEPPLEVIRRQNLGRAEVVDDAVIDQYIEKLEVPDATEAHEVVWT